MRQWGIGATIFGLTLAILGGIALAEYVRSTSRGSSSSGNDSFEEAVDPNQYRNGVRNPDWQTQELTSSGFKALHQEHVQILRELADLKSSLEQLKGGK